MDFVQELIKAMENNVNPFVKEWNHGPQGEPCNYQGKPYRNTNWMHLYLVSHFMGYKHNNWILFKQASSKGYFVRKGERGTQIYIYLPEEETEEGKRKRLVTRTYTVFNVEQLNSIPEEYKIELIENKDQRVTRCDLFLSNLLNAGTITLKEGNPAFSKTLGVIYMPDYKDFTSADGFYSTFFHELSHWASNRLEEIKFSKWGDEDYAYQELVAEITACRLMSYFGLSNEIRPNSVSYLKHWASKISEDKKYLMNANSFSNKVFNEILLVSGEKKPDTDNQESKEEVLQ